MSRWYLGSMNDGLIIIDRAPLTGNDVPPGIYPGDPELILNVACLTEVQAQAIVDAHNATLGVPWLDAALNEGDGVYRP